MAESLGSRPPGFFRRLIKRLRHWLRHRKESCSDNDVSVKKNSFSLREVQKLEIGSIPDHIRVLIFKRMSTSALYRIKQTNTTTNHFLETNRNLIEPPLFMLELRIDKNNKETILYSLLPLSSENPEVLINANNTGNFTTRQSYHGVLGELPPCRIYSILLADFASVPPRYWIRNLNKVLKKGPLICDTLKLENFTALHWDTSKVLQFFQVSRLVVVGGLSLSQLSSIAFIKPFGEIDFGLTLDIPLPVEKYISHLSKVTVRDVSHDTAIELVLNLLEEVGIERKKRGALRSFTVTFDLQSKEDSVLQMTTFPQFELLYRGTNEKQNTHQQASIFRIEVDEGKAYIFQYGVT